jgi:predicted esterase
MAAARGFLTLPDMIKRLTPRRRRSLARHLPAALAATISLGVLAPSAVLAADRPAAPPTTAPAVFQLAGQVISVEELPAELWLPSTARAHRLRYISTGWLGLPSVVSGAVFVPSGPEPADGWPVVSWAHGTVGVADACAPSVAGRSARDVTYLSAWLEAGYAVVATDYQGLNTFGRHPYLDGESAAYDVTNMVRAARHVEPSLSNEWLAVGQSQGAHAALFTGALAPDYAPELDLRGTIATAPPTQWRTLLVDAGPLRPEAPANPFGIEVLAGVETTHPLSFRTGRYLTPLGREVYKAALAADCFPQTAGKVAGLLNADIYDMNAAEFEQLIVRMEEQDIPIAAYDAPVYIAQGTADTVVYPPASATTAEQLSAAGSDVVFEQYDDTDHNGLLAAALPDLLVWAADRMAGG